MPAKTTTAAKTRAAKRTSAKPNPNSRAADRAAIVSALTALPAMPLQDAAYCANLPPSTMNMLRARGEGPRVFKLGRRLMVTQEEFRDWLNRAAAEAA